MLRRELRQVIDRNLIWLNKQKANRNLKWFQRGYELRPKQHLNLGGEMLDKK